MAEGFYFDPLGYRELVDAEIPDYAELQDRTAQACSGMAARTVLELGTGTGETALRVLEHCPRARYVGLDENEGMLAHARTRLPSSALFVVSRLEEELPGGPFDLVFSALAIHHLDGPGKADLFRRIAAVLAPTGRFVLADLVVPEDPDDVVTPIDGAYDTPSTLAEQRDWLHAAGLASRVAWSQRDLAVVVAEPRDDGRFVQDTAGPPG
jgi:tRNA (cmo5U34)-methyltransferase